MKKVFVLLILGLIASSILLVCWYQKQEAQAKIVPDDESIVMPEKSSDMCFAMALDPQIRAHRAGEGLGPLPKSAADYHSTPVVALSEVRGSGVKGGGVARAVAAKWNIWTKADTVTQETGSPLVLKVQLLGGHTKVQFSGRNIAERDLVKQVAPEWSKHANIRFEFVESGASDIRVAFNSNNVNESYIGTDAMRFPDKPTMNLSLRGRLYPNRLILHEFGHALGLLHEHQHPKLTFQWDESAVIADHSGTGWTLDDIERNVLNRFKMDQTNFSAFDPHSIMLYPIPQHWTKGTFETGYNTELSSTDKTFIGQMYGKDPWNQETLPIAYVDEIWVDHNQYQNGRKGIRIHVKFRINNFKREVGKACAYFYYKSGKPLKDLNRAYYSQDGNVSINGNFAPGYVRTFYKDYTLFMPYQELHMKRGKHDLKFMVAIYNPGARKWLSNNSGWVHFRYTLL